MRIRIGTRRSHLAMSQTRQVAGMIRSARADVEVELVPMVTAGDRHRGRLADAGGKGLFTAQLEQALQAGEIDLAVHSAKDMPAVFAGSLAILAVPRRADARDALASRHAGLAALPEGATVGTGSPRRSAQLSSLREDLLVEAIRGNVETRLARALSDEADLDAVVLAMAGLERSGLLERHAGWVHPLDVGRVVPAAGQGTLAVQGLARRDDLREVLAPLEDADARAALEAERSVVRDLQADCHSSLGVHVRRAGGGWEASAMVSRRGGGDVRRYRLDAPTSDEAARGLRDALGADGAAAILRA